MEIKFKPIKKGVTNPDLIISAEGFAFITQYDELDCETKDMHLTSLEQIFLYTGLRDKNSRWIYFNDPLKIEGIGIVKVVFKFGAFGYNISDSFFSFAMDIADGSFNVDNNNCIQEIEVIDD